MAFLYESLDSLDFEHLCADIVGDITGTALSIYARGCDGGIDASEFLCENPKCPRIIVQAKHYYHSTYSNLRAALTADVDKLRAYASTGTALYLMTSRRLTRGNKEELRAIARGTGFATCEVWAEQDISRFLEKESHADILRAHYKLWITHSGVLEELYNRDVFIDCEYYLDTADEDARSFVPTEVFDAAREKLEDSHAIMLVGDPGTGKTVLSEMLALGYAADGYTVRYTTSTDVHDVMSALSPSREARELVVLDDFLGGNLLEVRESQVAAVCSLVHHVRNMPGKRVILNSRVSILNEARRRDVSQRMNRGFRNVPIVSTNRLASLEKARIMIALMRREGVSADCIQSLMETCFDRPWYRYLVEHRNFNPRIVEFACRRPTYESVPASRFASLLTKLLDNPSQVWESEFERLTPSDRCLLHALYTMPRGVCDGERVRAAYERRVAHDSSIDASVDSFTRSLARLNDSLVRSAVERDGSISLSAANPSINDYIAGELKRGDALCLRMIQGAEYLDQIERVAEANQSPLVRDEVRGMVSSGHLLEMPTLGRDVHEVGLGVLGMLDLFDGEVRATALKCVDVCLVHGHTRCREPMSYVVRYARWSESSQDDDGVLADALCEETRVTLLVRRATVLDDLGALADLYERVYGPLLGSKLKRTFDGAFESLLYERVADYCMDHMVELADESGMQPYEVGEDEWVFVDDDELERLRVHCAERLNERVDDILDYADYGIHEAIERNWDWDRAARLVQADVDAYLETEDFDFLAEVPSPATSSRSTNAKSTDADIDRLFEEFAESLR